MTAPHPLRTVADIRKEQCVECLEEALEHAKAGEYSSVTIMAESVDTDAMYWSHTPCKETFVELLGKLDVLKWKVYQRMIETTEVLP
jgi:hypothetical protein